MKSAQLVGNPETRQWFPIQSSQSLLCICIDLDIYLYLRQILFPTKALVKIKTPTHLLLISVLGFI